MDQQKIQKTLYLLPDKKVDYLLTELKIAKPQKVESEQLFTSKIKTEVT